MPHCSGRHTSGRGAVVTHPIWGWQRARQLSEAGVEATVVFRESLAQTFEYRRHNHFLSLRFAFQRQQLILQQQKWDISLDTRNIHQGLFAALEFVLHSIGDHFHQSRQEKLSIFLLWIQDRLELFCAKWSDSYSATDAWQRSEKDFFFFWYRNVCVPIFCSLLTVERFPLWQRTGVLMAELHCAPLITSEQVNTRQVTSLFEVVDQPLFRKPVASKDWGFPCKMIQMSPLAK